MEVVVAVVAAAVSGVVAVGLSAITVAAVPCVVFVSLQSLDIAAAAAVVDFVILVLAFAALFVSATAAVAVVVLVLGIAGDAVEGCSRISGSWSNHRRVGPSSRPVAVDCYGSQGSLRRYHHGAQDHVGCRD